MPNHCFGGSGRCLVGGRRDAVSCSHERVTVSARVVKRVPADTHVTPPIYSAQLCSSLWGLVTYTMLLFWPQLTWGERTLVRYTPQVRENFYTTVIINMFSPHVHEFRSWDLFRFFNAKTKELRLMCFCFSQNYQRGKNKSRPLLFPPRCPDEDVKWQHHSESVLHMEHVCSKAFWVKPFFKYYLQTKTLSGGGMEEFEVPLQVSIFLLWVHYFKTHFCKNKKGKSFDRPLTSTSF